MNWAQRLRWVLNVDVEICDQCGGMVKVTACIEDPAVIKKSLDHLHKTAPSVGRLSMEARNPGRFPAGAMQELKVAEFFRGQASNTE